MPNQALATPSTPSPLRLVEPPAHPDRQTRKAAAARLVQSRRKKQLVLGTGFLAFLTAGWFSPVLGYFIPVCMLAGIGLASFQGRTWCDWLCPRGSFSDALLKPLSRQRYIPALFRRLPMRLAVMTLLMTVLTVQIIRLWPDPWAIGGFFVILLTVTTTAAVALGLIFQQRTWCYVCPIGTMSSWVGKNRRPLALAEDKCTQCNRCARTCPMQLAPAAMADGQPLPYRGDCLKCGLCVAHCPTAALSFPTTKS